MLCCMGGFEYSIHQSKKRFFPHIFILCTHFKKGFVLGRRMISNGWCAESGDGRGEGAQTEKDQCRLI